MKNTVQARRNVAPKRTPSQVQITTPVPSVDTLQHCADSMHFAVQATEKLIDLTDALLNEAFPLFDKRGQREVNAMTSLSCAVMNNLRSESEKLLAAAYPKPAKLN